MIEKFTQRTFTIFSTLSLGLTFFLSPTGVEAHAFGQNFALPIPVWLYLYSGAGIVIISFLCMILFELRAQKNTESFSDDAKMSFAVTPMVVNIFSWLFRFLSLVIFVTVLLSSVLGKELPTQNFASLFVWIIFYLGMSYISLFLGDVWRFLDPIRAMISLFGRGHLLEYPKRLGYFPALLGFMLFVWLELLSLGWASQPANILLLIAVYTLCTLIGAFVFGMESWYRYADFFSVLFRLIGEAAPLAYRDGRVYFRLPFSALYKIESDRFSLSLFIIFMLAATVFDGFRETKIWISFYHIVFPHVIFLGEMISVVVSTLGLIFTFVVLFYLYLAALKVSLHVTRTKVSLWSICGRFSFALIPIAIGYNVAHYLTLLLIQGQSFITVMSDPFQFGWNLFGTDDFVPNIGLIGAQAVWHLQVAVIVSAHIVAIVLGHHVARRVFNTKNAIIISQIPILLLMVLYTVLGLWLLSLPMGIG